MGIADDIAARLIAGEGAATDVEPKQPGFFARIGSHLTNRADQLREITSAPPETNVESLEKGLQVLGTGAGTVLDVGGEILLTGFHFLKKGMSAVTPDFIEDPIVSKVGDAFESIVGTDVAQAGLQAAAQGIEAYQEWATEHPRAAKDVAALANIALVATPVRIKPRTGLKPPPQPTSIGNAATAVTAKAKSQVETTRTRFLEDLVRPKQTPTVRTAQVPRTAEGGIVTPRVITPSTTEQSIVKTLESVPSVSSKQTLLENFAAINAELSREAKALSIVLSATSSLNIPRQTIKDSMVGVMDILKANPLLVGDAAKVGERTVAKAIALMKANPNTPGGVFKARQQLDVWVKAQRPKVFDPANESALSIAVRETRQAMNTLVSDNMRNVSVKQSLARQTDMYRAMDNIGPKAADEAGTAVSRLNQRVAKATGIKSPAGRALVATGVATGGGLMFAAHPALIVGGAALVGLGFAGGKLIVSPKTKKAIGALLRAADKAIEKAKGQGKVDLVRQLRADRIAVIEIMRIQTEK